jgi:hypothetical protein
MSDDKPWEPPKPIRLESWQSTEIKAQWKIVKTIDYSDVPGEIITAIEETGECCVQIGSDAKALSFGPGGIRLVRR